MSNQEYICVAWEDTDNIMTWLVPLRNDEKPEDAMRKLVLESGEWPFNHWNEFDFTSHINEWRCFRLVNNAEIINRLKKIQWPPTMDSGIDPYSQGLHKLAVFEAFAIEPSVQRHTQIRNILNMPYEERRALEEDE